MLIRPKQRIHIAHTAPDVILYNLNNHLILSLGTHFWYPSSKEKGVTSFLHLIFFFFLFILPQGKKQQQKNLIQTSISNQACDTWLRFVHILLIGTNRINRHFLKTESWLYSLLMVWQKKAMPVIQNITVFGDNKTSCAQMLNSGKSI